MYDLNEYVKNLGNKTFDEMPFSDVDSLVFSELAYVNMDYLFSEGIDKITLGDIPLSRLTNDIFEGSVDYKENKKMLIDMIKSDRFKDIVVKRPVRIFSSENINQFFAMTLVFPDGTKYLAFRGTDTTFVGWNEDFLMAYQKCILSQLQALEFAREELKDDDCNYYLGGHSKGGNLAFYVALSIDKKNLDNLIKAYSFDGPGFKDGITHFPNYDLVIDRLFKFRTFHNFVGGLFNNMEKYTVVYSNGVLLGGHDPFYWFIKEDGTFETRKDISKMARYSLDRFSDFVDNVSDKDKMLVTDVLFTIVEDNKTIYDYIKHLPRNLMSIKKKLDHYSKEDKKRLWNLITTLLSYFLKFNKGKEEPKEKITTAHKM